MRATTILVGSLTALREVVLDGRLELVEGSDVVVVPTAAAFSGLGAAALDVAATFEGTGATLETLNVGARAASGDANVVERVRRADVVVLTDGSAMHARSVWRATPVGEALGGARCLVAVGSTASVLGEVMIDPRGGAPTTGLGYRRGPVVGVSASDEQLRRTRTLLGGDVLFAVLGPRGVLTHDGTTWRRASDDVVVTRGLDAAEL